MVHFRQNAPDVMVSAMVAPALKTVIMTDSGCDPRAFLWLRVTAPSSQAVAVCVVYMPCWNSTTEDAAAANRVYRSTLPDRPEAHAQLQAAVQRYRISMPVFVMGDLNLRVGTDTPTRWCGMSSDPPVPDDGSLWPPTGEPIHPKKGRERAPSPFFTPLRGVSSNGIYQMGNNK